MSYVPTVWQPEARFYRLDGIIGCGASGTVFSAYYYPNIDKTPSTQNQNSSSSAGVISNTINNTNFNSAQMTQTSSNNVTTLNSHYIQSDVRYPCAIKAINLDRTSLKLDVLRTETKLMAQCNHPNLVPIYCSFVYGSFLWLVMPKLSISASDIMRTLHQNGFEEPVIASMLYDVLCGIEYLHNNKHIHRDIKSGNILLNTDGTAMLADFGVSAMFNDENALDLATNQGEVKDPMLVRDSNLRQTFVGSLMWLSPEIIAKKPYNEKTDIWALGITAIELAQGEPPNARVPTMQAFMAILKGEPPELSKNKSYTGHFKEFVSLCLQKDPQKRPTATFLLNHPFLKKINKKNHVFTILKDFDELCIRSAAKNMNDYINYRLTRILRHKMQNQQNQQKSLVMIEGGAVELLDDENYDDNQIMNAFLEGVASMTDAQCINSPDPCVRLYYYRRINCDNLPPSAKTEQELLANPLVKELRALDTEFCVCEKISGGKYLRVLQNDELTRVKSGNKILQTVNRPAVLNAIIYKAWDFTEDDSQIESDGSNQLNGNNMQVEPAQIQKPQIHTGQPVAVGAIADAKHQLEHENSSREMVLDIQPENQTVPTGNSGYTTQFYSGVPSSNDTMYHNGATTIVGPSQDTIVSSSSATIIVSDSASMVQRNTKTVLQDDVNEIETNSVEHGISNIQKKVEVDNETQQTSVHTSPAAQQIIIENHNDVAKTELVLNLGGTSNHGNNEEIPIPEQNLDKKDNVGDVPSSGIQNEKYNSGESSQENVEVVEQRPPTNLDNEIPINSNGDDHQENVEITNANTEQEINENMQNENNEKQSIESFIANLKNIPQSSQTAFKSMVSIFQELEELRIENAALRSQNDKLKKRIRMFAQLEPNK